MSRKKVVYIVADVEKALAFEWIAQGLSGDFDLFFLLIGKKDTPMERAFHKLNIQCEVITDEACPSLLKKWFSVFSILRREKPDVMHAHLWRAMLLGLTAAWLLRVKQRIFTRHHAMVHYREYPSGLKWDRLCNFLATDIVAISENIKDILVEQDKAGLHKIHVIHHGFDLEYFQQTHNASVQNLRERYDLSEDHYPVIGVFARYLEWKGIQYIIPAFQKIKTMYPKAHLVLANAHGDYEQKIKELLRRLPEGSYTEIRFENDLASLYSILDVYIHTPVDQYVEAFGQTYIEALAAGVPGVFTLSGVAAEFIKNSYNAIVVPHKDSEAIVPAVQKILQDDAFRNAVVYEGERSVQQFSLEGMITKLKNLYA